MRTDRLQLLSFRGRGGDDQFAAISVRNAVVGAVPVQELLARDAQPRHQASRFVVDAGVDHLAVARGGHGADALGLFQHDHLAPGLRKLPCHGKADHARPDNDALNPVHSRYGVPWLALWEEI